MLPSRSASLRQTGAERSIGTTMEIHQLQYFVAVAEEGSFSNAAECASTSRSFAMIGNSKAASGQMPQNDVTARLMIEPVANFTERFYRV